MGDAAGRVAGDRSLTTAACTMATFVARAEAATADLATTTMAALLAAETTLPSDAADGDATLATNAVFPAAGGSMLRALPSGSR